MTFQVGIHSHAAFLCYNAQDAQTYLKIEAETAKEKMDEPKFVIESSIVIVKKW